MRVFKIDIDWLLLYLFDDVVSCSLSERLRIMLLVERLKEFMCTCERDIFENQCRRYWRKYIYTYRETNSGEFLLGIFSQWESDSCVGRFYHSFVADELYLRSIHVLFVENSSTP